MFRKIVQEAYKLRCTLHGPISGYSVLGIESRPNKAERTMRHAQFSNIFRPRLTASTLAGTPFVMASTLEPSGRGSGVSDPKVILEKTNPSEAGTPTVQVSSNTQPDVTNVAETATQSDVGNAAAGFLDKVVELRKELLHEAMAKNPEIKDKLVRAEELSEITTDPITSIFMRLTNTVHSWIAPDATIAQPATQLADATTTVLADVATNAGFVANHSWALGIIATTGLVKLTLSYLSVTQFRHYAAIRVNSLRNAVQTRLASISAAVGPTTGRDLAQIAELRNAVRLRLARANPDSQDPLKVPVAKPAPLVGVRVIGHTLYWCFAGFPFVFLLNAVYNLPQHSGVRAEMAAEPFLHLDSLVATDPTFFLPATVAATWLYNLYIDKKEREDFGNKMSPVTLGVSASAAVGLPIFFQMSGFTGAMYLMLIAHNVFALGLTQMLRQPSVQRLLGIEDVRPATKEWELLFRPPGLNDPTVVAQADPRLHMHATAASAASATQSVKKGRSTATKAQTTEIKGAKKVPPTPIPTPAPTAAKPTKPVTPASPSETSILESDAAVTQQSIVGDDAPATYSSATTQQKLQQRLYQEQLQKQIEEQQKQLRKLQAENVQRVADQSNKQDTKN